ncbi:MAG TPA: G1 family glutamic endopeptidase [Chloroflexota bacterium]
MQQHTVTRVLPLAASLVLLAGCATPAALTQAQQQVAAAPAKVAQVQRQVSAAVSAAQSAAAAAATITETSTTSAATSSTASAAPPQVAAITTTTSTATAPAATSTGAATQARAARVTASVGVTQAVQKVIQQANDEQQAAFAKHDPTLMQDTATSSYYQDLVQTNQDMANSGVASIKLLKLQWGAVTQQGASLVQATTNETWQTTLSDGTVDQSTDRNVYVLVLQNGAWKIQTDDHPDANQGIPGSSASGQPGTLPSPSTPPVPLTIGESHNWSGYAATGGTYTAVTGTWKVPSVAATTAGSDATWVGIGGVQTHDLIQAGTEALVSGAGNVHYEAWIELLPSSSHTVPLVVTPGDSVTVTITQQSAGNWLVAFKNNTTGKTYQAPEQYTSSLSSAEWVEEAPSGGRRVVPLDQFGSVQFSGGSTVKDGTTDTIAKAGAKAITMADRNGQPIAKPTALSADGAGFTVSRLADTTPVAPAQGTAPNQLFPGTGGNGRGFGNGSGVGSIAPAGFQGPLA